MIIVYVKHYLNPQGLTFFKAQWFPEVERLIRQQKGFVAIETHPDSADHECMHITVKFIDQPTLDAWGATEDHARVLTQLDPFRTKAWNYAVTHDESISPAHLEWGEVPLEK